MWALTDDLRFPSSYDSAQQQKTRTVMYSFAEDGSLVELRAQAGNGRRKRRTDPAPKTPTPGVRGTKKSRNDPGTPTGSALAYAASAGGGAKRGARGKRDKQSEWAISMWPDIDNMPGPVHMSREETHAAAQFVIESDRLTVWNDKGYRMAKASHGVEQGAWYFEAQVLAPVRPEFNLRIGWSQISGDLQANCGYDVFSYSYRAKPCTRFHAAIGSPYGEDYGPGDTIGMLIYLPELDSDELLDLADRKWRPSERYRQFTYTRPESQRPMYADGIPPLPVLAGSELVYFKNGKCLGPAFQKLYLGKYHPAISSYMGGKVRVNFGPDFAFPPPATWTDGTPIRPVSDLEVAAPKPPADAPEDAAAASGAAPTKSASEPAPELDVKPVVLAPEPASEPALPAPEPAPEPASEPAPEPDVKPVVPASSPAATPGTPPAAAESQDSAPPAAEPSDPVPPATEPTEAPEPPAEPQAGDQ
ncbi:transcription factor, contains a PHD finger motif [Coemansia nantahalensis]|nr:transcription factor, contains a PHD finger motif [Coemansia nantahalensis]